MSLKYPNKRKRPGYWIRYEHADIKNCRKVWDVTYRLVLEEGVPFSFSQKGRKPNLDKEEYVCMAVLYAYFDNDFREVEKQIPLLTGKSLDHTNCVRWFGRLTTEYVNNLVFSVHKKILGISDVGDYISDSTKITCDRYEAKEIVEKDTLKLEMLKLHILVMYLVSLGIVSIVSVFASNGEANDSPILRKKLLKKNKTTHHAKTNLALVKNVKGYDWVFATNIILENIARYVGIYKPRWNIETMFRVHDEAKIKSKSTKPVTRLFYFTISMLLLLIWNLHYKTKTTFKLFTTILYEQKFFTQLKIPYTPPL